MQAPLAKSQPLDCEGVLGGDERGRTAFHRLAPPTAPESEPETFAVGVATASPYAVASIGSISWASSTSSSTASTPSSVWGGSTCQRFRAQLMISPRRC